MRLFKWTKGRQGTGYDKMLLLTGLYPLPFDCYLLRYPVGSEVPPHIDPVSEGLKHYRLNIVIKKSKDGGEFKCSDPIFETDRIKFFRPDLRLHSVTKVGGSSRYVLSIGWVLKENL